MRLHWPLACMLLVLTLACSASSQVRRGAADRLEPFRQGRSDRAAEPQLAPGRQVSVEIVIADVWGDFNERDMTAEKLAELDKAGKVTSLSRMRLSALENLPAVVQSGEQVPVVTGRTFTGLSATAARQGARSFDPSQMLRSLDANGNETIEPDELSGRSAFFVRSAAERAGLDVSQPLPIDKLRSAFQQARGDGGGSPQEVFALHNVGTLVSATTRVEQDESILVELKVEQSRLAPVAEPAAEEDGAARTDRRTSTITSQTTVRVPPGKTIVAGSNQTKRAQGAEQTWILVSAKAEAARPKEADNASVLKVFTLAHAQAETIGQLMQSLFRSDGLHFGMDNRTNSLVVQGTAEQLDLIQGLIMRLDEAGEMPPGQRD